AKEIEQAASAGAVKIMYAAPAKAAQPAVTKKEDPAIKPVTAPAKGKIYYNLYGEQTEPSKPGDLVSAGERICYIQTNSYIDEIICPWEGEVAEIAVAQGANVNKGDILFMIREKKRRKSKKKPV
ncbi:MAG: biotin/lipoyl-containing protein, partial [Bacteroidales bacterium]